MMRKMLTGDGRKDLTYEEFIGAPKKGPKTGRGQMRKMLTGDGRKNLTFDEFIGAPKKSKSKSNTEKEWIF